MSNVGSLVCPIHLVRDDIEAGMESTTSESEHRTSMVDRGARWCTDIMSTRGSVTGNMTPRWRNTIRQSSRHEEVDVAGRRCLRVHVPFQSRTLMRCTARHEHRNAETQPYDDLRLRGGRANSGHRLCGDSFNIIIIIVIVAIVRLSTDRPCTLHVYMDSLRKLPSRLPVMTALRRTPASFLRLESCDQVRAATSFGRSCRGTRVVHWGVDPNSPGLSNLTACHVFLHSTIQI